ncbi:MAG: peptide chain release factor N(5)-glutamine methyltransferase [Candidatus Nanopelagicales bacterium]|nr:peptide chain release factor N(5)-glutamine methyltransferase [Candidatus Nanopelagicales bacterium]
MSVDVNRTIGGRTTVRDVLFDSERRLKAVGVPSPSVDAALLVAFALGVQRNRLIMQDEVTAEQRVHVEQLLTQRLSRVPLQHLLGEVGFRRIDVAVGPGVFIPRPETELVAEAALRELHDKPIGQRIGVDLCAGSGAIAISLGVEVEHARIHAVELSDDAIAWTQRNVRAHDDLLASRGSRVEVIHDDAAHVADEGRPLARLSGQVSVVVSNPPYIPDAMIPREVEVRDHEPKIALYGGEDGLTVVRQVLRTAALLLVPGGLLVIEHADVQGQDAGLRGVPGVTSAMRADHEIAGRTGIALGTPVWTGVADRIDLNGLPRFTIARRVQ